MLSSAGLVEKYDREDYYLFRASSARLIRWCYREGEQVNPVFPEGFDAQITTCLVKLRAEFRIRPVDEFKWF